MESGRLALESYVVRYRRHGSDASVPRAHEDKPSMVINARSIDEITLDAAAMLTEQLEAQRVRWGFSL